MKLETGGLLHHVFYRVGDHYVLLYQDAPDFAYLSPAPDLNVNGVLFNHLSIGRGGQCVGYAVQTLGTVNHSPYSVMVSRKAYHKNMEQSTNVELMFRLEGLRVLCSPHLTILLSTYRTQFSNHLQLN